MLPGPLFAVTIQRSTERKSAGLLISLGHGVVEVPLIFLIYFWLSQFVIPNYVSVTIGLVGGLLMIYMGLNAFRNRNKKIESKNSRNDSFLSGIWTTAANAGFILWWLTVGTTLVLNAKIFGLVGFSIFTIVHWLCDFTWYTVIAVLIFKSRKFWNKKMRKVTLLFSLFVFVGFGVWFFISSILSLFNYM